MLADKDLFDADWYLTRYPDVAQSGLDPVDHFHWLGKRLGRLPVPPRDSRTQRDDGGKEGKRTQGDQSGATDDFSNAAIADALKRLCNWLFPNNDRKYGVTAGQCFDLVANNFWNDESNGRVAFNPNGRLLIEFMRDFGKQAKVSQSQRKIAHAPDNILLISYYAPTRSHAGGLRILDLYEEIRERHPSTKLTLFCSRNPKVDGDISNLDQVFDEIFICEPGDFSAETLMTLMQGSRNFGLIDLQFQQAGLLADRFRNFGKHLIYTPMEVLSRADFDIVRKRAREPEFPLDKFFSLIHRGAEEHKVMQSVDTTICVSDADAEFLQLFCGEATVSYFPTGLSRSEFSEQLAPSYKPQPFKARKRRLVFAAYFGSDTNSAGLEWYLREVHPHVLAAVPDYNLAVVGRGDTSKLQRLKAKSVSFIGEVPRLGPVLEQCRAGLVLALHGSGFRGKINQYALCGLPSISTSLGVTGLDYKIDENILVADAPLAFAERCIASLTQDRKTQKIAKAARQHALDSYTWGAIWPKIAPLYHFA